MIKFWYVPHIKLLYGVKRQEMMRVNHLYHGAFCNLES